MTITAEIIARLESEASLLQQVKGAAEFSALQDRLTRVPAAFVIVLQDRPRGDGRTTVQTVQVVDRTFGIVLADRRHGDPLGGERSDDIEPVREDVRAALLGWTPASAHLQLSYAGGGVVGLRNSEMWWMDRYTTALAIQGGF